jgi:basic membrane protein A and related proteins
VRVMKLAAIVAASTLVLAACGSNNEDSGSTSPTGTSNTTAQKSDVKVGLAYDIGGRGDKSFNDAAAAGLEKAKSEFGVETKELEAKPGETDAQKEERLRLLAQGGYNTVIAVGFAYATALKKVAGDFPDVHFAIVDDASIQAPNVADLVFAENEGSFLVGAAAALKSKSNHVGFVGGVNVPLIQKFQAGFDAGAKAVNADIKIDNKYLTQPPDFSGFQDPAKGKVAGQGMYQGGADVVFAAAGSSGLGVFQAAKDAKAMAIGVDSDQYNTVDAALKDVVMTSMIKKVDVAVYNFIKSVTEKSPLSGTQTFDLKAGGVDYSTSGGMVDDIKTKLDEFKQKIISGEIKVPDSVS